MIEDLIQSVLKAGEKILEIYHSADFGVEKKKDDSPLTRADLASHRELVKYLETTGIPIISEEGKIPAYEIRKNYKQYWLIDPLDGTKEFIKKNDEFTVNVALIENQEPILGVVYAPVLRHLYYGEKNKGAFKRTQQPNNPQPQQPNNLTTYKPNNPQTQKQITTSKPKNKLIIVASRSHNNKETEDYIAQVAKNFETVEIISKGSSLKLVEVAEGKAHIYPRFGPTMEWDTAAAHAVVLAAGGSVTQANGEELVYTKEEVLNPFFIVKG
jgi:3'(2'), 5'-bisphosphate nucleotidase